MIAKFFGTIIIILQFSVALAETTGNLGCETMINCTVTTGNRTTTTSTQNAAGTLNNNAMSGYTTVTTTTNYANAGSSGSGVYTQAAEAKNQSNIMMIAAVGAGVMYATRCGPHHATACMLAAAAFTAAGLANQKKNQAQNLMDSLGTTDRPQGTVDTAGSTDASVLSDLNKIKASLANAGYSVDSNGNIGLPNGSSVNGDLSASSLKAAGVSDGDIRQLQKELDGLKKGMRDKAGEGGDSLLARDGGSSGYGRVSISSLDGSDRDVASTTEAERTGIDQDPNAWSGFYKKFGDGVIGVPQSDIFLMVEKRVEKERTGMGH